MIVKVTVALWKPHCSDFEIVKFTEIDVRFTEEMIETMKIASYSIYYENVTDLSSSPNRLLENISIP